MQEEESASLPVTFDPPLRALWSGPSACPQAGSRVWCWPAGGAASGPPIVRSPAQEEEEEEKLLKSLLKSFKKFVCGLRTSDSAPQES